MKRAVAIPARCAPLLAAALSLACLTAPPEEDGWTRLEITNASPDALPAMQPGEEVDMKIQGRITFREILTGSVVAEMRFTSDSTVAAFRPDRTDPSIASARMIDTLLMGSVSGGNAVLPVTGFDHLIRDFLLDFRAVVPAEGGAPFLVLYMAEEVEEVEVESGGDSLLIDPMLTSEQAVLAAGIRLGGIAP